MREGTNRPTTDLSRTRMESTEKGLSKTVNLHKGKRQKTQLTSKGWNAAKNRESGRKVGFNEEREGSRDVSFGKEKGWKMLNLGER